jgi:hypothetical protein
VRLRSKQREDGVTGDSLVRLRGTLLLGHVGCVLLSRYYCVMVALIRQLSNAQEHWIAGSNLQNCLVFFVMKNRSGANDVRGYRMKGSRHPEEERCDATQIRHALHEKQ